MIIEKLKDIPLELWKVLGEMSPYLLFGFLVAGLMHVLIPTKIIEKQLGGKGILPAIKAALIGVPLPLCSCGVIPVAASLRKNGASREATTAFLISTPQTGVDSILVTFSLLGPIFAIFRPFAAFLEGVIGGWLVGIFAPKDETSFTAQEACTDECCAPENGNTQSGRISRIFRYGFIVLPRDIGKSLVIGLLIAACISAFIPDNFFFGILGHGIVAMLIMMAVGIPLYVCATASVPIAASLIAKGVSPGAALVFLMTGPATNAATLAVIWQTMGRRTASIYLATIAVFSIAFGFLLDYIFVLGKTTASAPIDLMPPIWFDTLCSVALILLLANALVKFPGKSKKAVKPDMHILKLKVNGMT